MAASDPNPATDPRPGVAAAILAGGASRRMGRDKALVVVGGSPMAVRVAGAVAGVGTVAFFVGREGTLAGLPCIPDAATPARGPLAGLVSAFGHAGGRDVLLVAVDHAFVRSATLGHIVACADGRSAVIPRHDGHLQVACALYPASWAEAAAAEAAAGGSIRSLLSRMPVRIVEPAQWRAWGEDGRSWFSVDDEAAVATGTARYG